MRACQPRNLINQALGLASYLGKERRLTTELLQAACKTYFVVESYRRGSPQPGGAASLASSCFVLRAGFFGAGFSFIFGSCFGLSFGFSLGSCGLQVVHSRAFSMMLSRSPLTGASNGLMTTIDVCVIAVYSSSPANEAVSVTLDPSADVRHHQARNHRAARRASATRVADAGNSS